jgi:type I restriction enzyme R subunit
MGVMPEWKHHDPERFATAIANIPETNVREFQSRRARREHLELDRCHGSCVLRTPAWSRLLSEALQYFDQERWWLGDYVIMPNHVHLLACPGEEWPLEDVLASVKKFTARRMPKSGDNEADAIWEQESYDRIVRDTEELAAYREDVAMNPFKANLREGEFVYHRALWLDAWASS